MKPIFKLSDILLIILFIPNVIFTFQGNAFNAFASGMLLMSFFWLTFIARPLWKLVEHYKNK